MESQKPSNQRKRRTSKARGGVSNTTRVGLGFSASVEKQKKAKGPRTSQKNTAGQQHLDEFFLPEHKGASSEKPKTHVEKPKTD